MLEAEADGVHNVRVCRIITRKRLREYAAVHPKAKASLDYWEYTVRHANWQSPAELKQTFNNVDPATVASGHRVYVFNLQGNEHRLVAAIHFDKGCVYVLRILTHKEYDSQRWKDEL